MKRPYLVQRLNKPTNYTNPFAFGGGLVNGGINQDAMDIISKVVAFDYMGSAEFEWGAVPKALQTLNEAPKLATFTLAVKFEDHEDKEIYGICLPDNLEEVNEWVLNAAKGKHGNLKEHLGLREALTEQKYSRAVGWLKIEEKDYCDEPFMFFVDKEMFQNMLQLFEMR